MLKALYHPFATAALYKNLKNLTTRTPIPSVLSPQRAVCPKRGEHFLARIFLGDGNPWSWYYCKKCPKLVPSNLSKKMFRIAKRRWPVCYCCTVQETKSCLHSDSKRFVPTTGLQIKTGVAVFGENIYGWRRRPITRLLPQSRFGDGFTLNPTNLTSKTGLRFWKGYNPFTTAALYVQKSLRNMTLKTMAPIPRVLSPQRDCSPKTGGSTFWPKKKKMVDGSP